MQESRQQEISERDRKGGKIQEDLFMRRDIPRIKKLKQYKELSYDESPNLKKQRT